MDRQVLFGPTVREKILQGVNTLAEAVATTLGPKGRNVTIQMGPYEFDTYHDGVTVAKSIYLKDKAANAAAIQLKEAAQKTNDVAGDGTTTATILAQAIINESFKQIGSGANPQTLKKEIEESSKVVLEELAKLATKITTDEEIEQVATISAADPVLGKLVAEALKKVGKDGVVTTEVGNGVETTVTYTEGLEFDRGYATTSPYFITNHETVESVIENPYILLTDRKLTRDYDVVPFIENYIKAGGSKDLVIIAGEISAEALATLVVNRLKGGWNLLAIQAPAFGDRRIEELEDLAIVTGGKAILEDSGRKLDSVTIDELGRADKIICDRDKTLIVGGKGDKKLIEDKVEKLREQIKVANTDYDREIKKQRLAKIAGGVAVINAGGYSETEIKEKKERIIDAVNATKAAIEEGIVAGGEITLLNLAQGDGILAKALKSPLKRLVENAGYEYAEIREKLAGTKYPTGIDVIDGQVKDLIKAGVIDPVKVTKSALQNAVSVACMMITTACLVVDEPEDVK